MRSRKIGKLIKREETKFSGLDASGLHDAINKGKKRERGGGGKKA